MQERSVEMLWATLFVNKIILEEVAENRYFKITMGLDYQRLFDSMLHKWFIKDLEPAKVPQKKIAI